MSRTTRRLVRSARRRAAMRGLPFDITVETLHWPLICPALGVVLDYDFSNTKNAAHPSLDQLTPRGGYTVANVRVISKRANEVKGNATPLELLMVAKYMAAELGLQLCIADDTVQTPPINPIGVPKMTENLKAIALNAAITLHKDADSAVTAAKKFHAFLSGVADATPAKTPAATPAGKAATGKSATAGKPATTAGATPEAKAAARLAAKQAAEAAAEDAADDEAEEEGATEGPTKQEVGDVIKALMKAGMRPQAKDLLSEFGAEALSGIAEDDYAAFIDKANELLMAA